MKKTILILAALIIFVSGILLLRSQAYVRGDTESCAALSKEETVSIDTIVAVKKVMSEEEWKIFKAESELKIKELRKKIQGAYDLDRSEWEILKREFSNDIKRLRNTLKNISVEERKEVSARP